MGGRRCRRRHHDGRKKQNVDVNVKNDLEQDQSTEAEAAAQALALFKYISQSNFDSDGATNKAREKALQVDDHDFKRLKKNRHKNKDD